MGWRTVAVLLSACSLACCSSGPLDQQPTDDAVLPAETADPVDIAVAAAAAAAAAAASFVLSNTLGDHMVLQRDSPEAKVWGFAAPGDMVTTTLGSTAALTTVADSHGVWRQRLPPQPASLTPQTIRFHSAMGGSATLRDVLFGDVYLCGGQSNMAVTVNYTFDARQEIALADHYPFIRLFTVGFFNQRNPAEERPQMQLGRKGNVKIEQPWAVGSSASVHDVNDLTDGSNFGAFSAVCWYFGRTLADSLNHTVPLGLISSNIGGTPIQAWSPAAANTACDAPPYPPFLPFPPKPGVKPTPCPYCLGNATLYNGNIAPFAAGPMALSGFLWYQGEANADVNQTQGYYDCALPALISTWREAFAAPRAFFAVVMLAAYVHDSTFSPDYIALLRDTQLASLRLENVALVTGTDLGDPGTAASPGGASTLHSVHPRNKRPLGRRLAAAAMDIQYGQTQYAAEHISPRYASATVTHHTLNDDDDGDEESRVLVISVVVKFLALPHGALPLLLLAEGEPNPPADPHGLASRCPASMGVPAAACAGFEVQTGDGVWHPAQAFAVGDDGDASLTLHANVTTIGAGRARIAVATRFGFGPWPVNTVVTAAGLPLLPWAPAPLDL